MNKKMSFVFALSILLSGMQLDAMKGRYAQLSDDDLFTNYQPTGGKGHGRGRIVTGVLLGAAVWSATAYFIGNKFTPTGRYNRATDIIDNLKNSYSRTFGESSKTTQDQVYSELGAFKGTLKSNRHFSHMNVIQSLDLLDSQLKRAESLLVAAKRGNGPQMCERLSVQAQKMYATMYAKFTKEPVAQVEEVKNHIELDGKIDALLIEVRKMQDKVSRIYGDIQFSPLFKQQLKEYEELRAQRSANTRSAVINFAIPTATVVGSLAALGLTIGKVVSWLLPSREHLVEEYELNNAVAPIKAASRRADERIDKLYTMLARQQDVEALNTSFARSQGAKGSTYNSNNY